MSGFTIRVYGILLDAGKRLLISDEFIRGGYFTKLPGGGLELGEGTRDCLKREFKEETGLDVEIGDHIYTTDFYQQSAFTPGEQIISIYYHVKTKEPVQLETKTKPFDFAPHQVADPKGETEVFRWIEWSQVHEDLMTLPIDKIVIRMLRENTQF